MSVTVNAVMAVEVADSISIFYCHRRQSRMLHIDGSVALRNDFNGVTATYGYDGVGQLTQVTLPDGSALTYTYDAAQRLTAIQDNAGHRLAYTLDAAGNRVKEEAFDPQGALAQTRGHAFDALSRLQSDLGAAGQASGYGYDATGNRSSLTIGASTYAYTYATGKNRLTKTAGPAPVRNFTYDAAGNIKGDGTASFTYDARGRMSQATRSGNTTTYAHNARGERVRKSGPLVSSGTNYFFYDEAGHLIGEYDQNGAPIAEYVWLEDLPVAVIKANEIHHVYTDQLDTPRVILDRLNRVRWRWDAEPFGTTMPNENPSGLGTFSFNLRLPGQYFDKETNLHYNYFRDYDPATGRYVQADPVGLAGGINPYGYVSGDPISRIDPLGLWTVEFGAFSGWGVSVNFGVDTRTGRSFGIFQFGYGLGGGALYDSNGGLPPGLSSVVDDCDDTPLFIGGIAKAGVTVPAVSADLLTLAAGVGRSDPKRPGDAPGLDGPKYASWDWGSFSFGTKWGIKAEISGGVQAILVDPPKGKARKCGCR